MSIKIPKVESESEPEPKCKSLEDIAHEEVESRTILNLELFGKPIKVVASPEVLRRTRAGERVIDGGDLEFYYQRTSCFVRLGAHDFRLLIEAARVAKTPQIASPFPKTINPKIEFPSISRTEVFLITTVAGFVISFIRDIWHLIF